MSEPNIETRVSNLETKVAVIETKIDERFDALMNSMNDFKAEMRDRDSQRAKEISELRAKHDADIKELREEFNAKFNEIDKKFDKIDAKFENLNVKIDGISKYTHQLFIAAAIGIAAMVLSVAIPLLSSTFKSNDAPKPESKAVIHTQIDQASDDQSSVEVAAKTSKGVGE